MKLGSAHLCKFMIWLALLMPTALVAEPMSWRTAARDLSAGDVPRAKALAFLRSQPALEATLSRELRGPGKYLALDVVTALKLSSLLNELMILAQAEDTGSFYLAINSLLNADNVHKIASHYHDHLYAKGTSPAQRMILLESLARMEVRLKPADLSNWLNDESPEVRSAALNYLRHFLLRKDERAYVPLLKKVKIQSRQHEAQLSNLLNELRRQKPASVGDS